MATDEWVSGIWEEATRDTPESRRQAEKAAREAEAEADRKRREDAARAENERLERARARALLEETEAMERRNEAAKVRAEQKRSRAAARRKKASGKDEVNDFLHKLGKSYHSNPGDRLRETLELCDSLGFHEVADDEPAHTRTGGSDRLVYSLEDQEGNLHYLSWTTYRMPSGRWEITAYIS